MAERTTNDLFGLVHTVTLLGYSDGTFTRVTSSAEKRLYLVQTDALFCTVAAGTGREGSG
jgi:hypothetical protein